MEQRYVMKPTLCPNCGHTINGGTDMLDIEKYKKIPSGTLGLCAYCAEVIIYLDEDEMAVVSPEQLLQVKEEAPALYENMMMAQRLLKETNDKT